MKKEPKKKEPDERFRTCAFTGHRPERLDHPPADVKDWLMVQIEKAVSDGFDRFLNGTQRGVDIWAAEAVIALKDRGADIKLISACPFRGMENGKGWDEQWRERFRNVIDRSDEVFYVSDTPGRAAFFARNDRLIERASRLIAVYSGGGGGTKDTIDRAERNGLEIIEFRPVKTAGERHIRIWLDDIRPAPEGYFHCHSVNEAKAKIRECERKGVVIDSIDCDHDLGDFAADGGDGIKLVDWLAAGKRFYHVELHTMNPVGRANMQSIIDRYWK